MKRERRTFSKEFKEQIVSLHASGVFRDGFTRFKKRITIDFD